MPLLLLKSRALKTFKVVRAIDGIKQIGLKGHSYVVPIASVESLTTLVTSLPRKELRKHVMVGFMGTPHYISW